VIHLDTSYLIDLLREQSRDRPGPATAWLEREAASELGVSLFVECELEAGAAGAAHPTREREKLRGVLAAVAIILPSERFAARYATTLVQIQRLSKSISTMDLLIATSALDAGAPLLTANRRHFDVVPGLELLTYR
jgi:tRNA(fMet)-specific endonuclease VapC